METLLLRLRWYLLVAIAAASAFSPAAPTAPVAPTQLEATTVSQTQVNLS